MLAIRVGRKLKAIGVIQIVNRELAYNTVYKAPRGPLRYGQPASPATARQSEFPLREHRPRAGRRRA
jgi:hypothetical protein